MVATSTPLRCVARHGAPGRPAASARAGLGARSGSLASSGYSASSLGAATSAFGGAGAAALRAAVPQAAVGAGTVRLVRRAGCGAAVCAEPHVVGRFLKLSGPR